MWERSHEATASSTRQALAQGPAGHGEAAEPCGENREAVSFDIK